MKVHTLDLITIITVAGNIGFSIYLKNSYATLGWVCALLTWLAYINKE